jgi:glycosyltransferase involved in cell wall biosynthesis
MGGSVVSLLSMLNAGKSLTYDVAGPFLPHVAERLRACGSVRRVLPLPGLSVRNLVRIPWTALRVLALVRRDRPDVILANGLTEAAVCSLAAWAGRCPMSVWVHNYQLPLSARLAGPLLRNRRLDVRWMVVSSIAADVSATVRGRRHCTLVRNPIDAESVSSTPRRPDGVLRVGYLGAPRPYKGFDLIPRIIDATVARTARSIEWYIFRNPGGAPDVDRELAARPGVHRMGLVYPQSAAYDQIDLVLCPSRQESFGRVTAEAMYNGLPVVASRIPAFQELLGHEAEASLFPVGDTAAAGRLIAALADDPELRRRVGEANAAVGRRFATEWILPEFEAVLSGGPTPSTAGDR